MAATWSIAKREIGAYFKSPIAFIVLAGFAFITGFLCFQDSFFMRGVASMESFFGTVPLILVLFAPAVTMRLLAEERAVGTIELLLTMPVRDLDVIVGKYIAAVFLLALAFAATVPFALTVGHLGDMDTGAVVGGYIGAFMMGCFYLAAGMLGSALSRDQVVAFVIGLVLCILLFVTQWLPVLESATPTFHYRNLTRGVVELRGVVFFVTGVAFFLTLSLHAIESRKWR